MAVLPSPLLFIASIPPVTRGFTAATIISSLFYAWLWWNGTLYTPYLTVVPGSSIFYPWTFVTSVLVETSIFELIGSLIFVPASLKYLERLWGSIETLKFIAVTVGFSNIIAFGFNWIEFIVTRDADLFLYGMQYRGQMALQIGILVAFTQLIPEHQVQVLGVLKARVKSLPMAYLGISTVLCILGFQCPWIIIQFGWFVSWIYLRFYKKNTGDSVGGDSYGDRSETFSLISWFPPFVHYPLSLLGNFVFSLATRLHLIPTSSGDVESGLYSQIPGSARAEAERRRAMALKALDQRLANTSTAPAANHAHGSTPPQAPRAPPPAAAARSDTAAMPSSPPPPRAERSKSGEIDIGEAPKARADSR
ncbi:eukaryotic integral membrane protein-domain-containing protein [Mycena rebaudengoi]|nr:eukaryotic integral membrane protein-domain-containing protein [Mycena rebaudengoi]